MKAILSTSVALWLLCSAGAFGQISPLEMFSQEFNGIAIWGSLGTAKNNALDVRDIGLGRLPVRYGFELILGPYPAEKEDPRLPHLRKAIDSIRLTLLIDTVRSGARKPSERRRSKADILLLSRLEEQKSALEEMAVEHAETSVELGVGFEYSDSFSFMNEGLKATFPVSGFYVSTYVTPSWATGKRYGFYCGGSAGLYDLSAATAYSLPDMAREYEMTSTTLSFDLVLPGFYYDIGGVTVFAECTYKYLAFDAIRYKELSEGPSPLNPPSRIDLSRWWVTVGFQFAKGL